MMNFITKKNEKHFSAFKKLLLLGLMLTPCYAEAQDENSDVAPKVDFSCSFEGVDIPEFVDEEIVTIDGKRWLFRNARVVSDKILGIPHGNYAAQIKAGFVDNKPASIELLDPVKGRTLSFSIVHSGIDRIINRSNSAWQIQASFDGGNTWAEQDLKFDTQCEASLQSFDVPVKDDAEYLFRIVFKDNNNNQGKDWCVLVDNIMTMEGNEYTIPWYVQPGNITNGFETAENSISFAPVLSGNTFYFGPDEFSWVNTQIEMTIDDREPIVYKTMPLDIVFTADNLEEGKHHMNIKFVKRPELEVWENAIQTDIDFYVRPITQVKGIAELRNAKVGHFFELLPENENTPIYINWASMTRAQKWLFDGKAGILVDDLRYLDPVTSMPENMLSVKSIRGQLLKINNNLIFRLDRKPEIDTLKTEQYRFQNLMCEDLSVIKNNFDYYVGYPLSLINIKIQPDGGFVDCRPNANILIEDKNGNRMTMQNIYADNFQQSTLPNSDRVIIFGIVGKSFYSDEPTVFPITALEYETNEIEDVADKEHFSARNINGKCMVNCSSETIINVYDVAGAIIKQHTVSGAAVIDLPKGIYMIKAIDRKGNNYETKILM